MIVATLSARMGTTDGGNAVRSRAMGAASGPRASLPRASRRSGVGKAKRRVYKSRGDGDGVARSTRSPWPFRLIALNRPATESRANATGPGDSTTRH